MTEKFAYGFLIVLFFLVSFPYFSPVRIELDTSPYYLVLLTFLLVGSALRGYILLDRRLLLLALGWLFFFILVLTVNILREDEWGIRVAVGFYAQLVLMVGVTTCLHTFSNRKMILGIACLFSRFVYYASYVWLAGALLQLFSKISGNEIGFYLTNLVVTTDQIGRTSEGRGTLSFAAEPSYAGLTCSILAAILYLAYRNGLLGKKQILVGISFYAIVGVMSISVVSMLSLITLFVFMLRRRAAVMGLVVAPPVFILAMAVLEWYPDLRLANLVNTLATEPALILADVSTASRASNILAYILALYIDHGWAGHFLADNPYMVQQAALDLLENDLAEPLQIGLEASGGGVKSKSSVGIMIFQFGILGTLFYLYMNFVFWKSFRDYKIVGYRPFFSVANLAYLIQVPFTFPTIIFTFTLFHLFGKSRILKTGLA